MARSLNEEESTAARAPLRLRVPAALAVAVVGVSATTAMSFGGCQDDPIPDPIDAGRIDRPLGDGGVDGGDDAFVPLPDAAPPH